MFYFNLTWITCYKSYFYDAIDVATNTSLVKSMNATVLPYQLVYPENKYSEINFAWTKLSTTI
jgi:hypothetical protein